MTTFEDLLFSESLGPFQERQLQPVVRSLFDGGMGLVPTDTQHAYVTAVTNKKGTRRIYDIKGVAPDERKPLSLLCSDFNMASRFADLGSLPRSWYAMLRKMLPGPYTIIVQATKEVPRVVLEHKSRRSQWRRREVGIRIPDCAIVTHLAEELGDPLLSSSACEGPHDVWGSNRDDLDFVVAGSDMASMWDDLADEDRISTIIDLTMEEPVLRREGMGDPSFLFGDE